MPKSKTSLSRAGRSTKRIGASKIVTKNKMPHFRGRSQIAGQNAAKQGGKEALAQAMELLILSGDGSWDPNTMATKNLKGADKGVYMDSGDLADALGIIDAKASPLSSVGEVDWRTVVSVGWDESLHEGSGITMAELASLHEYGNEENYFHGTHSPIPSRPWLSQVADVEARANAVQNQMIRTYLAWLKKGGM